MKVLVTGASGFIGNYVVEHLLEKGISVIASSSNKEKAQAFPWFEKVEYIELNLSSLPKNLYEFTGRPDKLIHLAWYGLPNYDSRIHFEKNLFDSYFFLKKLVEEGLKDITITGTCFEYGLREGKLSESMITNPINSYGIAKDTLRKFLFQLKNEYNFQIKWIRLFYMFGNGQNENSIIGQLEKAIKNNSKEFKMSKGEQLRDYLHVSTAAENIIKISLTNNYTDIINCSSGNPISIRNFIENYLKSNKKEIDLNLGFYKYPDYEPMAFWGNNQKLKKIK